jgi:hypothetical protein
MSKMITVRLAPEMAAPLLPAWERHRKELIAELRELKSNIKRVKAATKTTTDGAAAPINPQPIGAPRKTPLGRNKRGESMKLITQFLHSQNGSPGATIKEICAATRTAYGTARRILTQLEENGKATNAKGLWKAEIVH